MAEITGDLSIVVDLTGLDQTIARFAAIPALIEKYVNLIADEARHLVAVDTGALKASITVILEGMVAEITAGNDAVQYAPDNEYGNSKQAAHPFMRPAFERYAPAFVIALQALLDGS